MKIRNCIACAVLSFAGTGVFYAQTTVAEDFSWLEGNWEGKMGAGILTESWKKLDDQTLTGESYFILKGDTLMRELLTIRKFAGFWTYVPVIDDNHPVLFTLVEAGKNEFLFENKEHDFPQRIRYTLHADGSMTASIESAKKKNKKQQYQFQRKM